MRRRLAIIVSVWCLTGTMLSPVQARENNNAFAYRQRVSNGGFERGLIGWRTKGAKLVEDPLAAHRGTKCLLGEVRSPMTGSEILQSMPLRSDRMYRLVLWAKADNRSRLTVWLRKGDEQTVIANWQHVPSQWRRYRVNFTVETEGPATIRIVAPSAFWAPTGSMWIDDVSLFEMPRWEKVDLSGEAGFNDFPNMISDGSDTAWVAWISFRNGHDTIQLARLQRTANQLHPVGRWEVPGNSTRRTLEPVLASDGTDTWLVYASEHPGNWDLYAVFLDRQRGPGKPVRITNHPAVDVHPSAVVRDQTLWVVWESNREQGRRQIYLTALRAGVVGRPTRLSSIAYNNYQPNVVMTASGAIWVAWHSFRENNYDLYARAILGENPKAEQRLTFAPGIDRGVRMIASGEHIWMAWEHASYAGYKLGKASVKRVQLARLTEDGLFFPKGLRKTGLWKNAESPDLRLDRQGVLWVAARVPRDRNSGWDVYLWRVSGGEWSRPKVLSARKGMNRRPSVVIFGELVAVCYQGDDMPGRWITVEESAQKGSSGVYLSLVIDSAGTLGRTELVPYEPSEDSFEAALIRVARGEDRTGWTVSNRGHKLRLFFGDLHEHSDLSVCDRTRDETPDQSYQMMRDVAALDFGGLTDHGKCFNAYLWNYLGKLTRANADPGRFLTFLAQEWTSSIEKRTKKYPFGYYGHRNLVFADPFFPKWYNAANQKTPEQHWHDLWRDSADFVLIPHQLADKGNVPVDWNFNHQLAEPVAEIFQMRGSYECKGCPREARFSTPRGYFLQDAWARGIVIGVIASPDHEGGAGKAAVYAKELSRKAILDALRTRRTYGTTGAKILLDVRVNGLFMGELGDLAGGRPVQIDVRLDCPKPLKKVEIIRNNQTIFTARGKGNRLQFTYLDDPPPRGPSFYYVRVMQRDREMAWSSPVWLGRMPKLPSADTKHSVRGE